MVTKKITMNNVLIVSQMKVSKYFLVNIKMLRMVYGLTVNNVMMATMMQEMDVIILKLLLATIALIFLINLQFAISVQITAKNVSKLKIR